MHLINCSVHSNYGISLLTSTRYMSSNSASFPETSWCYYSVWLNAHYCKFSHKSLVTFFLLLGVLLESITIWLGRYTSVMYCGCFVGNWPVFEREFCGLKRPHYPEQVRVPFHPSSRHALFLSCLWVTPQPWPHRATTFSVNQLSNTLHFHARHLKSSLVAVSPCKHWVSSYNH